MSEKKKNPKIEFPSNVPQTVKIVKLFSQGEHEGNAWYGYAVEHEGQEKVLFANDVLHAEISPFPTGSTLVINWLEQKNERTGKTYHIWRVNEALFDGGGKSVEQPKDLLEDKQAYEEFRRKRKNVAYFCLEDAFEVADRFNGANQLQPESPYFLTHEDVRSLGISFLINFERKNG